MALGVPGAAELGVGLVDDDEPGAGRAQSAAMSCQRQRRAGRVVRRGAAAPRRALLGPMARGAVEVEGEVLRGGAGDLLGERVAGVVGVHRVRRGEAQRGAARSAEGLQQLEHDLVGAVGRPHAASVTRARRGVAAEVGGQVGAQRDGVPVGVAVEVAGGRGDRRGDVGDQSAPGR